MSRDADRRRDAGSSSLTARADAAGSCPAGCAGRRPCGPRLLRVISDVQGRFITGGETSELFDSLLADLLDSPRARRVHQRGPVRGGWHRSSRRDLTDATWNEESRQRFRSLSFFQSRHQYPHRSSRTIPHDLRTSRSSPGRPGLRAFLGLPLAHDAVGVAGIVNRPGGYDQELVDHLQPFLTTCANLIEAHRAEQRRRDAEQARLESEARMRAIVDTALDGILTIDEQGMIDRVNPAIERMFDRRACDLVQTHISALIPALALEGGRPGETASAERTQASVLGPTRDLVVVRPDGTSLPLEIVFSEMSLEGRRMFTGILRDISERQKVDRLKSEFVSTVSHELRTPLTSIRGSLGLLAGGWRASCRSRRGDDIAIALQNGERLGRLIDDILDMEKIASGRLEFRLRHIELMDIVRRSLDANQVTPPHTRSHSRSPGEMPSAIVRRRGSGDAGAGQPDLERDEVFSRRRDRDRHRSTAGGAGGSR